ncbi:MAG: N-acetyltransferase family protein [Tagaea sp.]
MHVRLSRDTDIPHIAAIYAHHVSHGTASFEEIPPDEAELAKRRLDILAKGFPYLVAEANGEILGYAYASLYRVRTAYRFTLEDSVYVAPAAIRKGVGRALMGALLPACEATGARQIVAVIGDSANRSSIGLHEAFGFERVGVLKSVGFKFGRWIDSVLMQRALGPGDSTLP